jgi:hypothetical protein
VAAGPDVTRDKFTGHVPDLVRSDQEVGSQYAPVVLTTNRDVASIPPNLTKRMVTCHIDAAIPENRSVTERIARRAQNEIGTALYRAYLQRLIPEVHAMPAEIDAEVEGFPDLLACFAALPHRRGVGRSAGLGAAPDLRRRFRDPPPPLPRSSRRDAGRRRPGDDQRARRRTDHQLRWRCRAMQFARSVPDFALKGRFADIVRLDLQALEQEMGFAVGRSAGWWRRLVGRSSGRW